MASTHRISSCIFYITLGFLWWISSPGDGSDGGDDGMWTFMACGPSPSSKSTREAIGEVTTAEMGKRVHEGVGKVLL
jgi:hypothetical protein